MRVSIKLFERILKTKLSASDRSERGKFPASSLRVFCGRPPLLLLPLSLAVPRAERTHLGAAISTRAGSSEFERQRASTGETNRNSCRGWNER